MKKKIILLSGDPNSINSEIIYKSLKNLPASIKKKIYLITNFNLIKKQFKILNYSIRLVQVKDINENISGDALKVININLDFKDPFKVSLNSASKFIKKSLNLTFNSLNSLPTDSTSSVLAKAIKSISSSLQSSSVKVLHVPLYKLITASYNTNS